jgi:cysteine-rich repeat protein
LLGRTLTRIVRLSILCLALDLAPRPAAAGVTKAISFGTGASISGDGRYVALAMSSDSQPGDSNGTVDIFVYDRQTDTFELASVSTAGVQGDGYSNVGFLSKNGRFVVFQSVATNLVPDDTNGVEDVFVRDLDNDVTTRVSVASGGGQANAASDRPSISADGRYAAFTSHADNLVADDTNGTPDIFVHDLLTGETTRVSVATGGVEVNNPDPFTKLGAVISYDGRYVPFSSFSDQLVPDDTNGAHDVFVHDRLTLETTRASVATGGVQQVSMFLGSTHRAISADGRFVAFATFGTNLVPDDTNEKRDAFVHDRLTLETTRVTVSSEGEQANDHSALFGWFDMTPDGRFVAFSSDATNLVAGDTNAALDVFVHDRSLGQTTRVSVSSQGDQGDRDSGGTRFSISEDGRFVAFDSQASNLDPGFLGAGSTFTVYVHERTCGDGTLDGGEQCDDGNLADGDGCHHTCTIEKCFACDGEPSICGCQVGAVCGAACGVTFHCVEDAGGCRCDETF